MVLCECGQWTEMPTPDYIIVRYRDGKIIYAVCIHGITVIDKGGIDSVEYNSYNWLAD